MTVFLETTIDKFTFRVDPGCLFSEEGVWVKPVDDGVRLGLSDFLQQRSGDMAFVEIKPPGTILKSGDEFASIETVKAIVALASPVSGTVTQINSLLETRPEVINEDPFGEGWLCEVALSDWDEDRQKLLPAGIYFEKMKQDAIEAQQS